MSQVGTAWCWPPDDHVCPLRPGWLMAFLSLRRVLCGLLEQEGVGCCAELPQGTACLPPYFPGSKSAPQVWETVGLPSQPAVAAGCETASLHHGPGFSATVPPPYAVSLLRAPFLPVPSLWGKTPELAPVSSFPCVPLQGANCLKL